VTINLLTSVLDDGLVMCADSMLTLTGSGPFYSGPVVTTFENAQKIIVLGDAQPAAAMVSGAADISGRLVSSFLRDVSRNISADASKRNGPGAVAEVIAVVDPSCLGMVRKMKVEAAEHYSQLDQLGEINAKRKEQGLPELTRVEPEQIGVEGDVVQPDDVVATVTLTPLTIVVCSYFTNEGPSATEIRWPGAQKRTCIPGGVLWWWGSGGSAVSRLIRGFDFDLLQSHVRGGDAAGSASAQQVIEYANQWAENYAMTAPVQSMPLQDAVEFTEYLGLVACGYDRFKQGPAGVGGPLDVLVLRHGEHDWVRCKRIHSSYAAR